MSKNQKLMLAAVLLLLFAAAKVLMLDWWQQQQPAAQQAVCDVAQGCTLPNGVAVKFSHPVPLQAPFDIVLSHVPEGVAEISVSFAMRDMDMGFNRYPLKSEGQGVWAARQIRLPLCTDSRRDYLADFRIGEAVFQTVFRAE